ncbi:MAG: hypothetical protein IPP19_11900 [Verrucomicrobia bacterium]|nr:hypothetical protein [Verrucomicrobiota bacterium]
MVVEGSLGMNMARTLLILFAIIILSIRVHADSWVTPTDDLQVFSGNGKFRFTALLPKRDNVAWPRHAIKAASKNKQDDSSRGDSCIGKLEVVGPKGDSTTLWMRPLVNSVTPLKVIVADSGKYVVTFDNWFGVGTDPIVIYNERGDLIRRHTLESLGLIKFTRGAAEYDIEDPLIDSSTASIYWQSNAIVQLSEDQQFLLARLYWGYTFSVRLSDGIVSIDCERYHAQLRKKMEEKIMAGFLSPDARSHRVAAILAGYSGDKNYIPALRPLLLDKSFNISKTSINGRYDHSARNYEIREAAVSALKR